MLVANARYPCPLSIPRSSWQLFFLPELIQAIYIYIIQPNGIMARRVFVSLEAVFSCFLQFLGKC